MKYQINPITVDAVKIAAVGEHLSNGDIRVLLEGQGPTSNGTIIHRHEMMGLPKPGDYLVTSEDGTRNLVPAEPFEATHTATGLPDPVAEPKIEHPELAVASPKRSDVETKHYADGVSATGTVPLPDKSPAGAPEIPAPATASGSTNG
jgi:hypothetical protein